MPTYRVVMIVKNTSLSTAGLRAELKSCLTDEVRLHDPDVEVLAIRQLFSEPDQGPGDGAERAGGEAP